MDVGPDGSLRLRDVPLRSIVERFGSPVHVVDVAALDRNIAEALADRSSADVFYSYKTNPVPAVLRRMHDRGVGAEVISAYELWLALELGVPGDRIIYNGPAKSAESLDRAVAVGALVNVNSTGDFTRLVEAAQRIGRPAITGIRVALPTMWGGQFGLRAGSDALAELVRQATEHPLIDLRALHVHRGFSMRTADDVARHASEVFCFCDELRQSTGWHPEQIDLGGSLCTPTVASIPPRQFRLNRAFGSDLLPPDPGDCITVGAAAALVAELAERHFGAAGLNIPRLIIEPGRGLTGNTQLLLTTVLDVKLDGEVAHAVLDAGINIAEPTTSEYHQLLHVTKPTAPPTTSYRLTGPICTPADVLYQNWRLPTLEPGDVVAIMDTGAYFVPFSTSFSFPRPPVVAIDGASVELVRRGETFEDLVRLDEHLGPTAPPGSVDAVDPPDVATEEL